MNDAYQGKIGTVSPAFGTYDIHTGINVDMGVSGVSGVTGSHETLVAWKWDQYVTGMSGSNNTHSNHKY